MLPSELSIGTFWFSIAKPNKKQRRDEEESVSIIVPTKNEAGHVKRIFEDVPSLGTYTEIIFVDGDSTDGTREMIRSSTKNYNGPLNIKLIEQTREGGKAAAVREGFQEASGDILMILDGDLTVPPDELEKFYLLLHENRADFINGSRMIYPMEKEAMRILNYIGNRFFAVALSYIMEQSITDALCGTKVLRRTDYELIQENPLSFRRFDPFGDFELLLGAFQNDLKIIEHPVVYKNREYGETAINRFSAGISLLWMTLHALWHFKLDK